MNMPSISRNSTDPLLSNPEQQSDLKQESAKLGDHSVNPARDLELPNIKHAATAAAADFNSIDVHRGGSSVLKEESSPLSFSIGSLASDDPDENPSITFSREERNSLKKGNVVTTETVTVTPGFFGNTSESTFTAYKLLDHFPENNPVSYRDDGATIAELFFSSAFHEILFTPVTIVTEQHITPATNDTREIKYTLKTQMPSQVPVIGGAELNDELQIRSEKHPLAEGGYIISHTLAKPSEYLNKLQFTITITPFQGKILTSFKILFEIKGVLGSTLHALINTDVIKELPSKTLLIFLETLSEEYTDSEVESEFSTSS